jgi:Fe-S-cluster containining protein
MLKKLVLLGCGKIRRTITVYLKPQKRENHLSRRSGECRRCGACCELMFSCPALEKNNGTSMCKIYSHRPTVCKTFPLNEKDLKDRDLVKPQQKCGFYFNGSC